MARKATAAFALGTDLVEFRVDYAGRATRHTVGQEDSPSSRKKAIIHSEAEGGGGQVRGQRGGRLRAISELQRSVPLYLDVELSTAKENPGWFAALPEGPRKIVSWHDFKATPPQPCWKGTRAGRGVLGDVAKIVTTAKAERGQQRVLKLYEEDPDALIAFCMGERGRPRASASLQLGSPVVYASLPGEPVAPGQLSVETVAG